MKKRHWLDLRDYMQVIGIHILLFIFVLLIQNNEVQLVLYEIANIGLCAAILIIKNYLIELDIRKQAKKETRLEQYKEIMRNNNQDLK